MPEGPEVRTVSDNLKFLINYQIVAIYVENNSYINGELLVPCNIENIYSVGKKLVFKSCQQYIVYSLGMTGRIQYEKGKHSHACFDISGFKIYFDDSRKFGKIDIFDENQYFSYINKLGPDILEREVDPQQWLEIFRRKNRSKIDAVLLEQEVISGIGNYLKSEILYYSGILPGRFIKDLCDEELERLRYHSHRIIRESYNQGGFTIKDFISPNGECGKFVPAVYGKKFDPNGYKVLTTSTNRNTFYVAELQS